LVISLLTNIADTLTAGRSCYIPVFRVVRNAATSYLLLQQNLAGPCWHESPPQRSGKRMDDPTFGPFVHSSGPRNPPPSPFGVSVSFLPSSLSWRFCSTSLHPPHRSCRRKGPDRLCVTPPPLFPIFFFLRDLSLFVSVVLVRCVCSLAAMSSFRLESEINLQAPLSAVFFALVFPNPRVPPSFLNSFFLPKARCSLARVHGLLTLRAFSRSPSDFG